LEKQEVHSLFPQLEQVVIFEASFTFFPHCTHLGTATTSNYGTPAEEIKLTGRVGPQIPDIKPGAPDPIRRRCS